MGQKNDVQITGAVICGTLSREELCRICRVDADFIDAMLSEGVIDSLELPEEEPQFSEHDLWRVRVASRLQRDLAVNLAGAALALDLLEEIERLRSRLERF